MSDRDDARHDVRGAMLAAVPSLRAFAISLCGDVDRANDLVQETLMRAWSHLDSFEPGTNMSAWLFTILRNHFRTEYRKRRREVEDADGGYAERLTTPEEQTALLVSRGEKLPDEPTIGWIFRWKGSPPQTEDVGA